MPNNASKRETTTVSLSILVLLKNSKPPSMVDLISIPKKSTIFLSLKFWLLFNKDAKMVSKNLSSLLPVQLSKTFKNNFFQLLHWQSKRNSWDISVLITSKSLLVYRLPSFKTTVLNLLLESKNLLLKIVLNNLKIQWVSFAIFVK